MSDFNQQNSFDINSPPVVLHVRVMAGTGGGPEKTILRSPAYINKAQYKVEAAYIHPANDKGIDSIVKQARNFNCTLHQIPERTPFNLHSAYSLLKLCRQLNVRIWHGHDYKSNLLGLILCRWHKMKLISTVHGWTDESRRMRLYRQIDQWCLRRYEKVVAVSSTLRNRCVEIGVPENRLSVINNAIDTREFMRIRATDQAKKSLAIDPATSVVGVIGRLSYEKGVDRFVEAIGPIAKKIHNLTVLIIGDGAERAKLQKRVRSLGIKDVVQFCGWCTPLQSWYEAMDLVVLPSRTEGLPNVVLEAMAMKTCVAATDVGGVKELLDNGRCGVILSDEAAEWPDQLINLLRADGQRAGYAELGRERIEKHFTFAQRVKHISQLYDQLLGQNTIIKAPDKALASVSV